MNDEVLLGFMMGLLGISYLIALRCRKIMKDVECIHDFVHFVGDNQHTSEDIVNTALDRIKHDTSDTDQVSQPFSDWDEA